MSNDVRSISDDGNRLDVAARLTALIDASQALADLESLPEILQFLIRLARKVTLSESCSLMMYDSLDELLRFRVVEDTVVDQQTADDLKKVELKLGQGITGSVALTQRSEIINHVQQDSRFFPGADKQTDTTTRNMMCVPLLHGDELLGVASARNAVGRENFDKEDLDLFQSFARLASVAIVRARLLGARLRQQRLEDDAAHAASIQRLFWPKMPEPVNGSTIWAFSRPAGFVGGDIYDVICLPDDSWLFYVADVSGKGMPAALVMAALCSRLRGEVVFCSQVDSLLSRLNRAMCQLSEGNKFFVTMLLGRYWPDSGKVNLARAGHPLPLWFRGAKQIRFPKTGDLPLGTIEDVEYESFDLTLHPGDSLLAFSDGVGEAMNQEGELFEKGALAEFIHNGTGAPWGPALVKTVDRWQCNLEPNDDLTVLEIWRK